jgi:streptogramin lyase
VGEGSIWVIGLARDVLWRIDRRGGGAVIAATIPLAGQPAGIAVGDGAVWVADATGAVLRIDPKRNEVVERIPITGVPHGLAFGLGRLWIALD